jgi:fibronectin type III domain protein
MRRLFLTALVLSIPVRAFSEPQACSYSLSTLSMVVPGEGGTGQVTVTTGASCPWTASSDRSWLTVLTPSGAGSGSVSWSAPANTLPYPRLGYLTIAGISIFVSQSTGPSSPPPLPTPTPTPTLSAPGPPRQFSATVSGNNVTLSWGAPDSGGTPSTYVIAAGSAAGWSNLGSFATGSTQTSYTAGNVPNGTYFARASAQNSAGTSAASNEVSFTVPQACATVPSAPSGLQSTVSGLVVTLSWVAPAGVALPAGYVIEAGTGPGLANIAVVNTGSAATTFAATAVPGTYYVRVRAASGCGPSPASGEVGIVVR